MAPPDDDRDASPDTTLVPHPYLPGTACGRSRRHARSRTPPSTAHFPVSHLAVVRGALAHPCLRSPLACLRHPLEALEIDERLRPAHDLGRRQTDEELLRSLERAHTDEPGAHSLENVRVGPGAHGQVVLAREAERLVVEAFEEQTGVVDLEDVDLRQVPVERGRVGDRMQAVERMRQVDDPALVADRRDRLAHREPPWDLLLEEESDHLPGLGLHLLAGDDRDAPAARELHRLSGAGEDVVIRDGDRAESLLLGVVEELGDGYGAVVRVLGVEVEVAEDEGASRMRVGRARDRAALAEDRAVEAFELLAEALDSLAGGLTAGALA